MDTAKAVLAQQTLTWQTKIDVLVQEKEKRIVIAKINNAINVLQEYLDERHGLFSSMKASFSKLQREKISLVEEYKKELDTLKNKVQETETQKIKESDFIKDLKELLDKMDKKHDALIAEQAHKLGQLGKRLNKLNTTHAVLLGNSFSPESDLKKPFSKVREILTVIINGLGKNLLFTVLGNMLSSLANAKNGTVFPSPISKAIQNHLLP
jgi:chromosome segregation ATPase